MYKEHNTNIVFNQGDVIPVSRAFAPSPSGRARVGGTGFKIWEPAKPGRLKGSGKAKGSVGLNTLIITDFQKLIAGRRGLGPWSLAIAEAIFDDAAPRIIRGAKTAKKDVNAKLQEWSQKWLPELVEAKGTDWVEERCEEIRDEKTGSFRTMDQIAKLLTITQDEVLGFTLYSLVAHDRPKAVREAENKQADAAKHKANRVAKGATPHELSKSRLKPWDAAGVSRATYYREQAEMKAAQARETDSSVTVLTYKVSDETVSQTDLARNSISVQGDQPEAEPLAIAPEDTTQAETSHTVEIDIGDRIVTIQIPMPARAPTVYSETRIRDQIQRLQAVAHIAQAEYAREVPFGASGSWF